MIYFRTFINITYIYKLDGVLTLRSDYRRAVRLDGVHRTAQIAGTQNRTQNTQISTNVASKCSIGAFTFFFKREKAKHGIFTASRLNQSLTVERDNRLPPKVSLNPCANHERLNL